MPLRHQLTNILLCRLQCLLVGLFVAFAPAEAVVAQKVMEMVQAMLTWVEVAVIRRSKHDDTGLLTARVR